MEGVTQWEIKAGKKIRTRIRNRDRADMRKNKKTAG